jgi:hypothetical protein
MCDFFFQQYSCVGHVTPSSAQRRLKCTIQSGCHVVCYLGKKQQTIKKNTHKETHTHAQNNMTCGRRKSWVYIQQQWHIGRLGCSEEENMGRHTRTQTDNQTGLEPTYYTLTHTHTQTHKLLTKTTMLYSAASCFNWWPSCSIKAKPEQYIKKHIKNNTHTQRPITIWLQDVKYNYRNPLTHLKRTSFLTLIYYKHAAACTACFKYLFICAMAGFELECF